MVESGVRLIHVGVGARSRLVGKSGEGCFDFRQVEERESRDEEQGNEND
jgi:hypothetical protein